MPETVLLVDFENVGKIQLDAVPPDVHVPFFFGASQKSVSKEFLKSALKLRERFEPIDIAGHGKNALDFHIAFYLGERLAKSPLATCIVLSKDKGFDPLLQYLVARGFNVRRAMTLEESFPPKRSSAAAPKQKTLDPEERVSQWLAEMPKAKRPRKRQALVAHLHNHFAKKIPEPEIQRLVEKMIALGKITETGGNISYRF